MEFDRYSTESPHHIFNFKCSYLRQHFLHHSAYLQLLSVAVYYCELICIMLSYSRDYLILTQPSNSGWVAPREIVV